MSNTAISFIPSPSERLLVRQILAKAHPERQGTFTREVALKAFEDTELPDAVLHEIWSIADDDNNGWLSERGLAIAVRLLGWAQKGEKVTEALTHRPGPLPIIGGIRNPFSVRKKSVLLKPKPLLVKPEHIQVRPRSGRILWGIKARPDATEDQLMTVLTPLTAHDMTEYMNIFQRNGPRNGLLAEEQARNVFAKSRLHAESLDKIWTLADTKKHGSLDFTDFAIGMHLIKASMAGQLPFIPTSLPPPLDELACAGRSPSSNRATLIGSCPSGVPSVHRAPPCDQSSNDPERIETVIKSLKPVHTGLQPLEQSHSSRGAGYSSLVAKISNGQTQFDILDKSLITTDAERGAPALKQGLDIQADNLLSLSTNMKDDQGQPEILNGSLRIDIANAGFKAPTINQSTPAAEQSQIDTLNRLIDASNTAKEELTRAFATLEIEHLSLSEKSRNDQGLIDALNVSLTTANSAYDGLRKVIASKATELTFLSTKTRNDQVQIDTLNRSLNAMEAEHQELRHAFASQEVELSSLSANSKNDQDQIDTLNQLLMTARTEQEELRQAFNSQATEFTSLSAKTRNNQVQIDSLKQSLDTAHVEQEELRRSFTSQATKISSLTATTKDDKSLLHNLARSLRRTKEEREAVKRALVSRTDELSVLSAETQDQRIRINALQTLLNTTTVEREMLKKTLSAQAAELLRVQDELSSANAAGTSLLDELREQVNEQTEELRSARKALGRAENDWSTMGSERVQTEIQIHALQGEVAYLTPRDTKHKSRTRPISKSAQSTNAIAGPSRTIPSHHPATYTRLHGTGLQPIRRHEQIQCLFECGICMDKKPVDDVTSFDPCSHQFCRDCVKNYISAKLDDRSFPIVCPVCMTDGGKTNPGMVTDAIVQQAGITERQFNKWMELAIAQYAVPVHCFKCKNTFNVDRQDLQEMNDISCPLPRCNHMWCKFCQQSINPNGPKHSCDGQSELNDLMKRSGWKYCPNCKTAIAKDSGCNHMTCTSCRTEFCYSCGGAYRGGSHSCQ